MTARQLGFLLSRFVLVPLKDMLDRRGLIAGQLFVATVGMLTAQIGMFGIVGLAGALGAARAGQWADTGQASLVTGAALALLALSWIASGQATWSL